ncbi:DUF3037 domain-containing protein [Sphaerisporangium corydalis]|uniref:DUF3037 domain-containing protein n=1 Tax=Sphaerisporangium corydalis TaxID=1441875 RepID=A0ABV9E7I3_9ACTN|nr:DUF3037 domain-containing protein [Sphaerisporangium corydalis]
MSLYLYSIVRCLPDPRTGEFVNFGAIAGNPDIGDWSIRQLSKVDRIRKIAGASALEAAASFVFEVDAEIDQSRSGLDEGFDPLGEDWLLNKHRNHRNVVQLSMPAPILADSAEEALEIVFGHLIIDPIAEPREQSVTKYDLNRGLRQAYRQARVAEPFVRPRAQVHIGAHVHSTIDFAIANGRTVQLTQAWSFRRAQLDEVSQQVKAWAYAMERLRGGEEARVVDTQNRMSTITRNVDLQVVIATPTTPEQIVAYEEAEQVFAGLNADVHPLEDVEAVGRRAAQLVSELR